MKKDEDGWMEFRLQRRGRGSFFLSLWWETWKSFLLISLLYNWSISPLLVLPEFHFAVTDRMTGKWHGHDERQKERERERREAQWNFSSVNCTPNSNDWGISCFIQLNSITWIFFVSFTSLPRSSLCPGPFVFLANKWSDFASFLLPSSLHLAPCCTWH